MKLLNFENFDLQVAPEALLIRPIRRLYNADRSEKKEKFFQQLSYLWFMVDVADEDARYDDLLA